VLKSLLLTVALPPGCFLYVALLGLLIMRRHRRSGGSLVCIGLAGLTVLSLPAVAVSLMVALEQNLPVDPPPNAMPEAIVILGGDVMRNAGPPLGLPGYLTLDRLRAGVELGRRTGLPILVTGGIVQDDRPAVATIMATSLREDFQLPAKWVEDASSDTWENASFSAAILRRQGIHSVYVVTQAWHMRRAVLAFRHTGLIVTAAPTSMNPPLDFLPSDFLPHASAWGLNYYALHEWIGCAWYAIR
jgi:uncharacterized SAM-binding protein YcdF (DUF218 family)